MIPAFRRLVDRRARTFLRRVENTFMTTSSKISKIFTIFRPKKFITHDWLNGSLLPLFYFEAKSILGGSYSLKFFLLSIYVATDDSKFARTLKISNDFSSVKDWSEIRNFYSGVKIRL